MPLILKFLSGLFLLWLAAAMVLFFFQRKLMYNPNTPVRTPHRFERPDLETVVFKTGDGIDLTSFFSAPKAGANGEPLPTVLYLHGNTGTAGDAAHKLIPIVNAGYGALLLEYRGFGGNKGKPDEKGLIADALAGVRYIRDRLGENARVVYYGMSMGTGVANGLAAVLSPDALVLECGFTSMTDAAQIHYPLFPLRLMITDSFKSKKRIASLTAPVLFLHGEKDSTVPVEQGKEMFDAAPVSDKTLKLYPDGHHVDLYDFGASDDVVSWLDKRFK